MYHVDVNFCQFLHFSLLILDMPFTDVVWWGMKAVCVCVGNIPIHATAKCRVVGLQCAMPSIPCLAGTDSSACPVVLWYNAARWQNICVCVCVWVCVCVFEMVLYCSSSLIQLSMYMCMLCSLHCRWHPRSIHGLASFVWVWRLPTGCKLPLPWGLCGQREAISWVHLPLACVQDKVWGELLSVARSPWMCQYQQNIRLLWWVCVAMYVYCIVSHCQLQQKTVLLP